MPAVLVESAAVVDELLPSATEFAMLVLAR